MRVGIPAESRPAERRVAALPETVAPLIAAGLGALVQSGAGAGAHTRDEEYRSVGAVVVPEHPAGSAEVVASVQPLDVEQAGRLRPGDVTVSFLPPAAELDLVRVLAERGVTAFSLDLLPRVTRAQPADALSSQALVAGYRAVLLAAQRLPRFLPMFTTAAGTVPPARVLVLGAGVAGLQAIATARRLGAVVEAYDVRSAAAEEVRSLGARFLELGLEGQGGVYADERSEEFLGRQRELLADRVAASDVVITTAAVPGRRAPVLVTAEMLKAMAPGSVVVDLAAESGGNCACSVAGEEVVVGDVLVHGARNLPSTMPVHASRLYARNVANLLLMMVSGGRIAPDLADEVIGGCCLTHDGEVRHAPTRALL
ncbi:NAD(P) transhydrogenase subunit alpha [Actinosynnema mirum]|uniref:proton-translocating NAD(P)(+) transhydrogenase n=1 Tax=Actinosynnema mirum (strain ATCC 29888 / DSM 43827 / JCM 3225 / NBRC 14064 / NCIMB 13271 / NRRL B-12336 / IMRU 3971 / 101) TaxID=446462 RepID=C6WRK4_ACTMD|nr:NAD(P) transhydrogenase subunit alpha [Actinosynnema mirum]ACU35256.1 alanine dehydrogenase/PNT domain protein [Actinosynnema mirum DSM 43827]AXX28629.1 NAD(P) transhydrogenase alpha subunit [Actinosynnema pretiosum subsp. pretiosum]